MERRNNNVQYGTPHLGAKDRETGWYENNEIVPDLPVYNTPDDIATGRDAQLEAAIQQMLRDLPPTAKK